MLEQLGCCTSTCSFVEIAFHLGETATREKFPRDRVTLLERLTPDSTSVDATICVPSMALFDD